MVRYKGKSYATEVCVCSSLINSIWVTNADIVDGQLFFVRGTIWRQCEAWLQVEGGLFEQLLWLGTDIQSTDKFPPCETSRSHGSKYEV
jgi:hypothetical protein